MKIATGAYTTSPNLSILSESSMTPLSVRRKKLCMNYGTRLLNRPNNQIFELISKTLDNKYNNKILKYKPIYKRLYTYLQEYSINHEELTTFRANSCTNGNMSIPTENSNKEQGFSNHSNYYNYILTAKHQYIIRKLNRSSSLALK